MPEEFSWYGESGAKKEPVYDEQKKGYWWMPTKPPEGKENELQGNRGYIFVGAKKPKVVEKIVEKPAEKIVEKIKVITLNLHDIYFPYDSAKLTPINIERLKENTKVLKENHNIKVLLVGSASPEGATDYNLKLSEKRVNAVKSYLIEKEGISEAQLQTKAEGEIEVPRTDWSFVRKVKFVIIN